MKRKGFWRNQWSPKAADNHQRIWIGTADELAMMTALDDARELVDFHGRHHGGPIAECQVYSIAECQVYCRISAALIATNGVGK